MFDFDSSDLMLTNVTFSSNSAKDGGGMSSASSYTTLTNVTFSGNSSEFSGGGMHNFYSVQTLTNVTFAGNSAPIGAGVLNDDGWLSITNTILWGNSPDQIADDLINPTIVTYSIIQGGYPGWNNISLDPRLGLLADNGGFTQTHALQHGSPAIDAGDPTSCPATDQRGVARPIDGDKDGIARCDIGAYEYLPYHNYLPLILKAPTAPDPIVNGDFEDGKTGWTESATTTRDLIVNSGFPAGVTPHSGLWAAWLGGDALEDTSTISQYVSIPAGRSMLHFWYWISAPEDCGHDFFTLSVGSAPLINWDLCIDSQTGGWVERTIDLSAYAGSSAWINLSVAVDDADTSQVFIDDVSFEIH